MSYLALYRKYRPKNFDEVVGQDAIIKTLTNQVKSGNLSHAYLFVGTRGVGKTTVARIFAQAVNCLNPVNGNPCHVCANCTQNSVDIVELDAASNNGVDQAREIRDKAQYLPSGNKYKIYIIDEAHMLSMSAFNALLKTLEEPPEHVIFILCTTEAQKLPATIVSRCMRFDFKLVPQNKLISLLGGVLDDMGIKYTTDALAAIASAGEGSARDTLSICDRCVALTDGNLTYESVLNALGSSSRDSVLQLNKAILASDVGEILNLFDVLLKDGRSVTTLSRDLGRNFRDILVVKTCKNPKAILGLPDDVMNCLAQIASTATDETLLQGLNTYAQLEAQLRNSLEQRTLIEAVTLQLALHKGLDLGQLNIRLTAVEKALQRGVGVAANPAQPKPLTPPTNVQSVKDFDRARTPWIDILNRVRERADLPLLGAILQNIRSVWCEGDALVVECEPTQYKMLADKDSQTFIKEILAKYHLGLRLIKQNNYAPSDDIKQIEKLADGKIDIINN